MTFRSITLTFLAAGVALAGSASAEDKAPLRALLITGGGYHDYVTQKKIVTEGVSARANVDWEFVLENPKKGEYPKIYQQKDWIKGFDVVVHNECYAKYSEDEGINSVVKAHVENGVGAVMIHCAMHTFRDGKTKEWDKLVGVESRRHGAKFPIVVKNVGAKHPVMLGTPATWTTPKGELYHTTILPSATALAVGFKDGQQDETKQACIWVNEYGKARTFATTLGHHNETMLQEGYLDLLTRGLLWSCGKLDANGKPAAGYGKTARLERDVKFRVLLANGRTERFGTGRELIRSGLTLDFVPCCGNE